MKDKTARTVFEAAMMAKELFNKNADTLVAGFLIRNPHINPGDIELVYQQTKDGMRFSVEAKELHVPVARSTDTGYAHDNGYAKGWNACRQAVIDMKAERKRGAQVAPLGTEHG